MNNIDTIIKANEKLVYKIASKYRYQYDIEDLFQVGMIGLINAYKNYDESLGTKFSTYAYNYILGEIVKYIKKDRMISVGDEYLNTYRLYRKTKEALTNKFGREATFDEISMFMEIDKSYLLCVLESTMFTKSIEQDDYSLLDTYFTDETLIVDNKLLIDDVLNGLNDFDRKLIIYRYYKDYSQSETAKVLGVNQVKVSRQEKLILSRMKSKIAV